MSYPLVSIGIRLLNIIGYKYIVYINNEVKSGCWHLVCFRAFRPNKETTMADKTMKLAEALLIRADMKKKLASLRERVAGNAVVQQDETPHEDPMELIKVANGVLEELEDLVLRIDAANMATTLPDGRSLAMLIAHRDKLAQQHSLIQVAI